MPYHPLTWPAPGFRPSCSPRTHSPSPGGRSAAGSSSSTITPASSIASPGSWSSVPGRGGSIRAGGRAMPSCSTIRRARRTSARCYKSFSLGALGPDAVYQMLLWVDLCAARRHDLSPPGPRPRPSLARAARGIPRAHAVGRLAERSRGRPALGPHRGAPRLVAPAPARPFPAAVDGAREAAPGRGADPRVHHPHPSRACPRRPRAGLPQRRRGARRPPRSNGTSRRSSRSPPAASPPSGSSRCSRTSRWRCRWPGATRRSARSRVRSSRGRCSSASASPRRSRAG